MARTACPRCGSPRAKPNARGPNHVWCPQCGGLVPLGAERERHGPFSNDPEYNAIAAETGRDREAFLNGKPTH